MDKQVKLSEMVAAMKEKAENAYLNGEIATARHLATVALENWPDRAPIQEISWCFAILLHCYKNDTDYFWLSNRFYIDAPFQKKYRFSINDTDDGLFIAFMMEILQPSISPKMMNQWRENFLQMSEPRLKDDVSTALLLETVIEMLCFFDMEEWEAVGIHFATTMKSSNRYVSCEVAQCVQRLSIQMRILNGENIPDKELNFLRSAEKLLACAWEAYFCSNFQVLDDLIPQLSNTVNCGDELFLAVQGLATATELQRSISRNRDPVNDVSNEDQEDVGSAGVPIARKIDTQKELRKEVSEPWEYAKYYRYQRFETERPLAAFLALREANAQKVTHQIREKGLSGETVASRCWELFRMLPSLWSSALKYWDLLSLLKMYELKMEFHWASASYFERGDYCGKADQAVDAIICGIMSVRSEPYKRKDVKRLIGILERYGSDEDIQRLYCFIFEKAPPITWNLCAEWLRLLGDLLPENQLQMCLNWTMCYHGRAGTLLTALNMEEYYYLHPILQHYMLSKDERENLKFHFERMFQTAPFKDSEFKTVLWYLADHDWEMCQELMEKMMLWDAYPRTQAIVINSCANLAQHNPKTLEFCTELLKRIGEKTGCEVYTRFASAIRNPKMAEAPNLQEVYTSFQKAIEVSTSSGYNSEAFRNVYDHIEGFNWSDVDGSSLWAILEIAIPILSGDKTVYPMYIVDVLSTLCLMFQSATIDAKQMLAGVLLKHTETFKSLLQPRNQNSKVWDTFRLDLYRPELLYNKLLFTFCQIYDGMTVSQKEIVLDYAEEGLYRYPQQAYYPTYLFMRAGMDDERLFSYASRGFAQLRTVAESDGEKGDAVLSEILRGIESAREINGEKLCIEKVGTFVLAIMELGTGSLSCTNRLRVANLVKSLSKIWIDEVQRIIERLIKDKRKSVRNAMSELRS